MLPFGFVPLCVCWLASLCPLPLRRVGNCNNKDRGSGMSSALLPGGFVRDYSTGQGRAWLVEMPVQVGLGQAAAGVTWTSAHLHCWVLGMEQLFKAETCRSDALTHLPHSERNLAGPRKQRNYKANNHTPFPLCETEWSLDYFLFWLSKDLELMQRVYVIGKKTWFFHQQHSL